jgi:hypothetical protein
LSIFIFRFRLYIVYFYFPIDDKTDGGASDAGVGLLIPVKPDLTTPCFLLAELKSRRFRPFAMRFGMPPSECRSKASEGREQSHAQSRFNRDEHGEHPPFDL